MQKSGFDRPDYLYNLTELQLNQLEENINKNRIILESIEIECSHKEMYKSRQNFKFLPGHRTLILRFAQSLAQSSRQANTEKLAEKTFDRTFEHPALSILLQNLIQTALSNYENSSSTSNRYPKLLMDFGIYIYITAGKACYEVIAANLPLPSASAICNDNFQN